jgi:hypothetical protein
MRFKYFSEEEWFLNGECRYCKRVMKIPRQLVQPDTDSISFTQPVACKCGHIMSGMDSPPVPIDDSAATADAAESQNRPSFTPTGLAISAAITGTFIAAILLVGRWAPAPVTDNDKEKSVVVTDATPPTAVVEPAQSAPHVCESGKELEGQFYPTKNDIPMRTGPSGTASRVINLRATQAFNETTYRDVGKVNVLGKACELNGWVEAQVIESEGRTVDWERGWVRKSQLSSKPSKDYAAGIVWDLDGDDGLKASERVLFRKGALRVLRDTPNCITVYTGFRSQTPGMYFVTCNGNHDESFNVWFTEQDLKTDTTLRPPVPYDELASRQMCHAGIRSEAGRLGQLDIHDVLGYVTNTFPNGNRITVQEFTHTSPSGAEMKFRASCNISPRGKLELAIAPL